MDKTHAASKIFQALTRLGLSFADSLGIVEYDPDANTAYWSYNPSTNIEKICVGPMISELDISSIEMVLRHEFLHRSTYHGFHERFADQQLLNIVEDICINRLLYEAYPDNMMKLSIQVYSDEAKKTVIALPDCSANPDILDPKLGALWRYIWKTGEFGEFSRLNPSSLYYQLVDLKSLIDLKQLLDLLPSVFADHSSHGQGNSLRMTGATEKVIEQLSKSLPQSSNTGDALNPFLSTSTQFGRNVVKDFIDTLRIDSLVTNSRNNLLETFKIVQNEPFQGFPSRTGMVLLSTGISEIFGIYQNIVTRTRPTQLRLCFYIDTSGSMAPHFASIYPFIKAVFDIPLEVKLFNTKLYSITVDSFLKGSFPIGGGTDFDLVIEDFVESEDVTDSILFTDGEGQISVKNQKQLRSSGKNLYVVLLVDNDQQVPQSDVSKAAKDTLILRR